MKNFNEWINENEEAVNAQSKMLALKICWEDCAHEYETAMKIFMQILTLAKRDLDTKERKKVNSAIEDAIQMIKGRH